jgi:type VI secretion system protein ImpK
LGQQAPAAPQNAFGQQPPAGGNTWIGGSVPQQPAAPSPYPQANIGQPTGGQAQGFFPGQQPAAPPPQSTHKGPQIGLQEALKATGLGAGGPSNPLLAASANLLILFGRLRTGMVEMQAEPLMQHVVAEIGMFEQNAVNAGADPMEAQIGKYALCGTADDIVQNLPGADRGRWIEYSMVAQFFQKRDSGVGFFQEAEKAMQAPGQRYQLLELMLVCLSLGFEGQYRTAPNGGMELTRIRAAIYETLRRVQGRPDEDISVNWTAVPLSGTKRYGAIPMWIVGAIAAVVVVGSYAGLSTYINNQGNDVARTLNLMHPNVAQISLIRSVAAVEYVPVVDTTQIERIKESLSAEIADGSVEIGEKGQYIFVRVGNALLFESGQAEVKSAFGPVAEKIAATLNTEPGPIIIQGYTDGIPASGRGRYKTNLELSVARAEGVQTVLNALITDPARLSVDGRGEADPIATNDTREGQALNRRVEMLVARRGTFEDDQASEETTAEEETETEAQE